MLYPLRASRASRNKPPADMPSAQTAVSECRSIAQRRSQNQSTRRRSDAISSVKTLHLAEMRGPARMRIRGGEFQKAGFQDSHPLLQSGETPSPPSQN